MDLLADSQYTLCTPGTPYVLGMTTVSHFWNAVSSQLSNILSRSLPVSVPALFLNDLSQLSVHGHQKRHLSAGLTAAKESVATRGKRLDKLSVSKRFLKFPTAHVISVKELNSGRTGSSPHTWTCSCWQSMCGMSRLACFLGFCPVVSYYYYNFGC